MKEIWPTKEEKAEQAKTETPKTTRFLKAQYDPEPIDFIGKDKKPVFRHCKRCGAVFFGQWESEPREGTTQLRPHYDGGIFVLQGVSSSSVFACSCEAAKINAPNSPPVPDWLLSLSADQGAPRVIKTLELIAFEEAVKKRKENEEREHQEQEETPPRREEAPSDRPDESETRGAGAPEDRDREKDRAGSDDFNSRESLDIDRALSDKPESEDDLFGDDARIEEDPFDVGGTA